MDWFVFLYMLVFQLRCGYNELIVSKNISGIRGSLVSPGFPGNYPNNVNYTWILDTDHEKATVNFKFDVFDIVRYHDYWGPCTDYLKITEIDPCCFTAMNRCGKRGPFSLFLSGRLIRITFVSDGRHTAGGFSLAWIVSRPTPMKTTTQTSTSITTTQKTTTRTTKPPELTTINPREDTKITTRTIFIEITTRTTKMRRETTLKTKAQKSSNNIYSTKQTTMKINLMTTPRVLAKKIKIMKETTPQSETFDPSSRSTNQTTILENRKIPKISKTTRVQITEYDCKYLLSADSLMIFPPKLNGYIFILQLILNGLFIITIALLGFKLKNIIRQRRESPHIYTSAIETQSQESGHYLKFPGSVLQKEEKVATVEESSVDYVEPIPVYVDVI